QKLRSIALNEEARICEPLIATVSTLTGISYSLSSLCSGSECLLQLVEEAVPKAIFEPNNSLSAAEIAVFVLDNLYKKLNDACLVQGGEEEAYQMLLYVFSGSLLPYIEVLDSWLYEGTLSDTEEEIFFYHNESISIDAAEFWDRSYLVRTVHHQKAGDLLGVNFGTTRVPLSLDSNAAYGTQFVSVPSSAKAGKEHYNKVLELCPLFLKDIAQSIMSAGKSLQLIRHFCSRVLLTNEMDVSGTINNGSFLGKCGKNQSLAGLTLGEVLLVSLAGLISQGDHISGLFLQNSFCGIKKFLSLESNQSTTEVGKIDETSMSGSNFPEKIWSKLLTDTFLPEPEKSIELKCDDTPNDSFTDISVVEDVPLFPSFCVGNPVITVCRNALKKDRHDWSDLHLSRNLLLPPLDDEILRDAIFCGQSGSSVVSRGTNYAHGFEFIESEYARKQSDSLLLESLFPFPTILPPFEENLQMSNFLPFQKNSTLPSRVLRWIQSFEPKFTPLPIVVVQECLIVIMKKQVELIGSQILLKLMNDWRLMDELGVLRAIYLLGAGDLLQHFLTVIFNGLDKGEEWDDDFELNTILQQSIRNSADGMLLSAPDSLVVSISRPNIEEKSVSTPRKVVEPRVGIDGLDSLKFMYKVPWPLELIANSEAIKKYNQVMNFLLKVKRAKFVLDKARRWMWKDRGLLTVHRKRHWLLEQKLLHFVDAFHQYVMDRVYHSAWRDLCEGMAAAGSLDEVMEVHEAYLTSIQRQCFIVPDKLWALIASRINSILTLALDLYTIRQTLSSGGAVSAIRARCEMEVDRIEKSFDDCIAFLLRVLSFKLNAGHFPHLADLVTRINYNYFYMSDSGNVINAPGSETASSRLGKVFLTRTE
uniref:Gamma-tubulin complex component n=1 Tax=Kalanchoe fedtschenkoi TaxID=63787 RepID=A0A7N0V8N9_KALFE